MVTSKAKKYWRLKSLQIENFKSYKGTHLIEPFDSFTAVIGPNGSGKSNLMDAISFVMGEKPANMRGRRVSDFIHGASVSQPSSNRASVAAVFINVNNDEKKFERIAAYNSSEYKIDNQSVSAADYVDVLEKEFNINVKAKNFLVYQGYVEQLAMKSPKEMTEIFEELSGSNAYKNDYDRLRKEMSKIKEEMVQLYQKKKGVNAERREAKLEKEEAERYTKKLRESQQKEYEFTLASLYYNERGMVELQDDLKSRKKDAEKLQSKKATAEESVKMKKKSQGEVNREIGKLEHEIREKEAKINKVKPQFISLKERLSYIKQKCETSKKNLVQAEKASEDHKREIERLEKEKSDAEKELEVFDAETTRELSERNSNLETRHITEYHRLKSEADRKSTKILQVIDSINREQKSDQDRLDDENTKIAEFNHLKTQKENTLNDLKKRVEKINERIESTNQSIVENERKKLELDGDVRNSKQKMERLQKKLETIIEQLGDAKTDKHEDSRRKKKEEIVEKFKSKFPGVYNRMLNLCQPVHQRYNVAVTKVLGKFMEAIIVDNEETARQCIQILKEQMLEPETFLPLDTLCARPLKQRLRTIDTCRGVKLVFDVLHFSPKAIERAVLFATNNALVAEDPDDAAKVAYDSKDGQHDVVALDGTFYQKSGIISGGSLDLAKKAKRWDEKQMNNLKTEKEKYTEELREEMKKSRKESELNTLDQQINGLKHRLKFAQADKNSLVTQIETIEEEIKRIEKDIEKINPRIKEITESMEKRINLIEKHKFDKDKVEDEVFRDFCREIGVENIRQFEDRDLKNQEIRKVKRYEFEVKIDRISSNLEFEKSRDILKNVSRWKDVVKTDEENHKKAVDEEKNCRNVIESNQNEVKELENKKSKLKKDLEIVEADLSKCRKELGSIVKEFQNMQKQIDSLKTKIESSKEERFNIIRNAAFDDIEIKLLSGSLDHINFDDQVLSEQTDFESSQSQEAVFNLKINYSDLTENITCIKELDDLKKYVDGMKAELRAIKEDVAKMQPPGMGLEEKLNEAVGRYMTANEEFELLKKKDRTCKQEFEKVKDLRRKKFLAFYDKIVDRIDGIYKELAKSPSAQAFLHLENPDEPFLDGVIYNCVAPGKRFQQMSNLSGGERTLAALALLFAIQTNYPAPFLILDEIDAALDVTNIKKLTDFIKNIIHETQVIVISLKPEFFTNAEAIIGVSPEDYAILSSGIYVLRINDDTTD